MKVRVLYPLSRGEMVLRSDDDWERDVPAVAVNGHRTRFDFDLGNGRPFRYFKALLRDEEGERWSQGDNLLALDTQRQHVVYPYFSPDATCHVCDLHVVPSSFVDRGYEVRVWVPPGYGENTLEHYPVLYMQDGQNLFFPEEAFGGRHWRVSETLGLLNTMNLIRQVVVVGIVPRDRMREYTAPGYEDYTRFLSEELKPWVDAHYRTCPGPKETAILGSSLGGVVSLRAAWEYPQVFGNAGCMSSTFGYRDDLMQRIAVDPKRSIRLYLDTGWPDDNYEVTRSLRLLLESRGFRDGVDLRYAAFPLARHDEEAWAQRIHLPFQFFFGR